MKETEKELAANAALRYIRPGMIIGLGSGSTVAYFISQLGTKASNGTISGIICVAASKSSEELAKKAGLSLLSINDVSRIDIAVDGADEFDPHLNLIKGGGGALLREKIIASLADLFIVIADSGKKVATLGAFKLPLEVFIFCIHPVLEKLKHKGFLPSLRTDSKNGIFITDNGNYIIDLDLKQIPDPYKLNDELCSIPGIIENGLFLRYAHIVLMAAGEEIIEFKRN